MQILRQIRKCDLCIQITHAYGASAGGREGGRGGDGQMSQRAAERARGAPSWCRPSLNRKSLHLSRGWDTHRGRHRLWDPISGGNFWKHKDLKDSFNTVSPPLATSADTLGVIFFSPPWVRKRRNVQRKEHKSHTPECKLCFLLYSSGLVFYCFWPNSGLLTHLVNNLSYLGGSMFFCCQWDKNNTQIR